VGEQVRATPEDISECIVIRGLSRENPISATRLAELGITSSSWGNSVRNGNYTGVIALNSNKNIGFCFGDTSSGEIMVLAVLPEFEFKGIGKNLLQRVMINLNELGHTRLFLGADYRPHIRAFGFY
jgi:GNAT superfamily N-acetyltransferase